MHAPFESCLEDQENISENIQVLAKNTVLAHGKAVKVIRENAKNKMFVDDGNVFGLNFWADPIILGFNGVL